MFPGLESIKFGFDRCPEKQNNATSNWEIYFRHILCKQQQKIKTKTLFVPYCCPTLLPYFHFRTVSYFELIATPFSAPLVCSREGRGARHDRYLSIADTPDPVSSPRSPKMRHGRKNSRFPKENLGNAVKSADLGYRGLGGIFIRYY